MKYVVVENSGHEKEFTWPPKFASVEKAFNFIQRKYKPDEIEKLHVMIALIKRNGETTYDF